MGFPIFTIIGFAATVVGFIYRNTLIFLIGLLFIFIAMALMSRGSPS